VVKPLGRQGKTGNYTCCRDSAIGNPLVAGSSLAHGFILCVGGLPAAVGEKRREPRREPRRAVFGGIRLGSWE